MNERCPDCGEEMEQIRGYWTCSKLGCVEIPITDNKGKDERE